MVYYDFMQRQIENYRSKIDREQSEERRLILSEQRETQRQERLKDHQNYKHQLNNVSKSTATHSTLIIDNHSSCKLRKNGNKYSKIEQGLKITNCILIP